MKMFKKAAKYLFFFFVFFGICALLAHCTFKRYAATSYKEAKKLIPFDAIIVPGMPYEDTAINLIYEARVLWAKHLYDSGYTKNIIFSGAAVYTPYIESRTMKMFVVAMGVPEANVYTEELAEHSSENVYFGWKLAHQLGFKKIALATDPYQSGMLRKVISSYTPGVMSLPIQFEKIDPRHTKLPKIDASSAKVSPFVALNHREGFWQRFQGTMGKRIKEDAGKTEK